MVLDSILTHDITVNGLSNIASHSSNSLTRVLHWKVVLVKIQQLLFGVDSVLLPSAPHSVTAAAAAI